MRHILSQTTYPLPYSFHALAHPFFLFVHDVYVYAYMSTYFCCFSGNAHFLRLKVGLAQS